MSRDDDLLISCVCGCTTIQRRGGYTTHTLADTLTLGLATRSLCRRHRLRWLANLSLALVVAVAGGGVVMRFVDAHGRGNADRKSAAVIGALARLSLLRAHERYMNLDYAAARAEVTAVLECDPSNDAALASLKTIKESGGDSSDRR